MSTRPLLAGVVGSAVDADAASGDRIGGPRLPVMIGAATSLFVVSALLATRSLSETPDTPCGSVVSPNFVDGRWSSDTQCGLVHLGTGLLVGWLLLTGAFLVLATGIASRGRASPRRALLVLAVASAVVMLAASWLAWRVTTVDEPVMRRGWTSLRNVTAGVGVGVAAVAVLLRAGGASPVRHRPPR